MYLTCIWINLEYRLCTVGADSPLEIDQDDRILTYIAEIKNCMYAPKVSLWLVPACSRNRDTLMINI
jgi:hypothetical protein